MSCSERPLSGVVPLTLWSWRSYVKHFINWSGWVKVVSSISQPLGVRWHGITSHFIQIGPSLVSLGFRWDCMDPYYLEYLEAGARDILSKPCVPILYDPITRQFEAWLDTPEAEVWNSEDKVESFKISSLLRGWTCSMWSQPKVFLLHVHTQRKGSQVPVLEQKIVLDIFGLTSSDFQFKSSFRVRVTTLAWLASSRVGSSTKAPGPLTKPRFGGKRFCKTNQQLPWI